MRRSSLLPTANDRVKLNAVGWFYAASPSQGLLGPRATRLASNRNTVTVGEIERIVS